MKLADVEPEKNVSELVVRVVSVAPPRMIKTRYGKTTQLIEVLISDEPGSSAILSLWGYGVGADLSAGKVIKIIDGWAKEWRGKVQLSLGKSGRYEELVDDGVDGFLFSAGSSEDLRFRIEEALADRSRLSEMGIKARRKAESEYSPRRYLRSLLSIYREFT